VHPSQSIGEGTDVPPEDSGIDIHTTAGKLADLDRRLDEAVHAGSAKAVEKQHAKGRKTARERIALLFDEGSFVELDELAKHRSTAARSACSPRTSPSSAGRSVRSTARRSPR
jgi:acetyl-CoA carboxylase carboxyltransferase component